METRRKGVRMGGGLERLEGLYHNDPPTDFLSCSFINISAFYWSHSGSVVQLIGTLKDHHLG